MLGTNDRRIIVGDIRFKKPSGFEYLRKYWKLRKEKGQEERNVICSMQGVGTASRATFHCCSDILSD